MSAPLIQKVKPLRFANYDLIHFLGRGGMGEVWSGIERWLVNGRNSRATPRGSGLVREPFSLQKSLALKLMHPEISAETAYRGMFLRETSIAMQLDCANIVSVFQVGEYDSMLYMAMQRVDGVNLFEFHQHVLAVGTGERMPLNVAVYITYSILTALFVAHEYVSLGKPAGIIHRDIKPGNIMVSSVGDVLLTDFGIARPVAQGNDGTGMQGTLRYMAPEQARGIAGIASDLFAVGAILEELITGKIFRDWCSTNKELECAILEHRIQDLDRTIPSELDYLRRRLLDPDPDRRVASAREAMSLVPIIDGGYRARLKIVQLYEKLVGDRSSGHTRGHRAATPSFLVARHERLESNLTARDILVSAAPVRAAEPASWPSEEDDTAVYHPKRDEAEDDMPWLEDERPPDSPRRPDTDAPIPVQRSRAGYQPAAITPTAVLISIAESKPTKPSSPAITPTEVLTPIAEPTPTKPPRASPEETSARAPSSVNTWAPPSPREQEKRDHRSACGILTTEPLDPPQPPSRLSRWAPKTATERWMALALIMMTVFVATLGAAFLVGASS